MGQEGLAVKGFHLIGQDLSEPGWLFWDWLLFSPLAQSLVGRVRLALCLAIFGAGACSSLGCGYLLLGHQATEAQVVSG